MTTWLKPAERLLEQNDWKGAGRYLKQRGLLLLPAMIDCHVHFRTPGHQHKEDWQSGSEAMVSGGIAAVIDMPNNAPPTVTLKTLNSKIRLVKRQIKYPVKYFFYLGAAGDSLPDQKALAKAVALKVYVGSSTGNLLVDRKKQLEKLFKAWPKLLAFHAEDEALFRQREKKYSSTSPEVHSKIRNDEVASRALKRIIGLAKKYGRSAYICHLSTRKEAELVRRAKQQGIKIYAETSPHHLLLDTGAYKKWKNFVKVNPPLRSKADIKALWQAVRDGTIDVIATDHAPHLPQEKRQPYPQAPSGIPELDTFLPLMLNAVNQRKISLARLIEVMHANPVKIFKLKSLEKYGAIVNLNLSKKVLKQNLKTKCGWSPYEGWNLKGWPVATILNNKIYLTKK